MWGRKKRASCPPPLRNQRESKAPASWAFRHLERRPECRDFGEQLHENITGGASSSEFTNKILVCFSAPHKHRNLKAFLTRN